MSWHRAAGFGTVQSSAGTIYFVGGTKSLIPLDEDNVQPSSVKDGTPKKENEKQVHNIFGSPYGLQVQAAEPPNIPLSNRFATLSEDENSKGEEGGSINSQETTKDKGDRTDEDKATQHKEKHKIDQKEKRHWWNFYKWICWN